MRVLVTGAGGQVGGAVARVLEGRAQVAAYDRATLDLEKPDDIRFCLREARPEVIVNAGAYTAVDRAEVEEDRARAVNAVAPGILGEEAKRAGALLIHYSTDYVFDGELERPYVETDATRPLSAYGRTKLEGERAVAASGCRYLILRTSWVYGPRGRNFMLTMLRFAAERDMLRIVDDQRGAPTSSAQLARATAALLDASREHSGIYHASASGVTTWFGFAGAIFEARRRKLGDAFRIPKLVPITTAEYPTPAKRPANSVLSNAKLENVFGLALGDWREGLEEALETLPD
ncbi:MAG: dTDP-4-dehydrorhamnose reductase [Burkholderiales bacterium]|nr:dTDP-4-dehydrorhamnose reductase [Burkholderiales bacterium]